MNILAGIPCTIMRGGTSKGVFIMKKDLPENRELRDRVILAIFGSPDIRQIDGLGGADSLTSKLAIIDYPDRKDVDVNYTFGQVSITEPFIDYSGNCGNISSAVGPFAIDKGIVSPKEGSTEVRILNTNTNKIIIAKINTKNGKVVYSGDYSIDGVPGTGAEIKMEFFDPAGSLTGKLLPTGKVCDEIKLSSGREIRVSIVDAGSPAVFVIAEDIGLKGIELPDEINSNYEILKILEEVRSISAEMLGFVKDRKDATSKSPFVPKVAFVSPARDYTSINKRFVSKDEIHLVGRIMSMQKLHKAYAITGSIPTGVAAMIPDSVVNNVSRKIEEGKIMIGHPSGIIDVEVKVKGFKDDLSIESVIVGRTARKIMDGTVYLPEDFKFDN